MAPRRCRLPKRPRARRPARCRSGRARPGPTSATCRVGVRRRDRPVVSQRRPEGDTQEGRADQAGDAFRDVAHGLQEHDRREAEDGPERSVLEIAVLGQRATLHQQQSQAAHEHRADAEADGDDEEVVGERERSDHAVEAEARVEHLQVEEPAQAGTPRLASGPTGCQQAPPRRPRRCTSRGRRCRRSGTRGAPRASAASATRSTATAVRAPARPPRCGPGARAAPRWRGSSALPSHGRGSASAPPSRGRRRRTPTPRRARW